MLYNKDWDKPKVKADPFSLESLIAWLEKMPADKGYAYTCNGQCLLAQYFTDCGYQNVGVGAFSWRHGPRSASTLETISVDFHDIAISHPRLKFKGATFGAALTRAREALARRA